MSAERLEVPLGSSGAVRLRAVGPSTLSLSLERADTAAWPLTARLVGRQTGLPPSVACSVTCRQQGHLDKVVSATLVTSGGQTRCDVELPAVFGAGRLDLEVQADFPYAPPAAIAAPVAFDVPCSVRPSAGGLRRVGDAIVFQAASDPRLARCALRVHVSEQDADEAAGGRDLDVLLGLTPSGAVTWRVGCDAAGKPDWAEAAEDDPTYELRYRVLASADGKAWEEVQAWAPLCKATRPSLTRFELVLRDEPEGHDLARDAAAERRAEEREDRGGDALGWSYLYARGSIAGLSPAAGLEVGVRLWRHRPWTPAPPPSAVAGPALPTSVLPKLDLWRVLNPVRDRVVAPVDEDGAFLVPLLDGAALSEEELRDLTLEAQRFAVLDLPGWSGRGLPLRDVLAYDPAVFTPFGDGDVARPSADPARRQTPADVASAVCSAGTSLGGVELGPMFLPVAATFEGADLVFSATLRGTDAKYWLAADPRFDVQVDGVWEDLPTTRVKEAAQARVSLAAKKPWRGHGKQALVRLSARKPGTLYRGEVTAAPAPAELPLTCKPWVGGTTTKLAPDGKTLVVRARTRYVDPGSPLVARLLGPGAAEPLKVTTGYGAPSQAGGGAVDAAGVLLAWFTLDQSTLARVKAGELTVEVKRVLDAGKVRGLDVTYDPPPTARV